MQWTPHGLIVVGIALVVWAVFGIGSGITADGLRSSVAGTALQASERMSREELKRVFEMPDDAKDPRAWIETRCGLFWARGIQVFVGWTVFGQGALGLTMCSWGALEMRCRRASARPTPLPAA